MIDFLAKRPTAAFDEECYVNYWSIAFKCVDTGRYKLFEMYEGKPLDRAGIALILRKWRIVGFNSTKYDCPMLALAMMPGTTNAQLKRASDELIMTGIPHWKWMKRMNLELPGFIDHIDLMEVNPGAAAKPSLKICGGRLHSKRMQDLPFDPSRVLSDEDMAALRTYHENDLDVTTDLYRELLTAIEFRAAQSVRYGMDLRSKSDAQMASAMLKHDVEAVLKDRVYRPEVREKVFSYAPPEWIHFEGAELQDLLDGIRTMQIVVDSAGQVLMPKYLSDRKIPIGQSVYRMGIGGLHSSEEGVTHISDEAGDLCDNDVASMYPNIILSAGLVPPAMGKAFSDVYRGILTGRIANKAKASELKKRIAGLGAAGDPVTLAKLKQAHAEAETVQLGQKTILNGSYGHLGNVYSVLYAPELMIQVTLTGQLFLLMCIERMERRGIKVVSANTDGFVSKVPSHLHGIYQSVLWDMQVESSLDLEETTYRSLHSRGVNDYFAVTTGGQLKTKGAYALSGPGQPGALGLKKNPAAEIASEAAGQFLLKGTPIEHTVHSCTDVRKFIVVRRVTGGATMDGVMIGKAIRWYYSTARNGPLFYAKDGKTVPRSDGAMPIMELPDGYVLPGDLDFAFYVREAYAILQDVGWGTHDPALAGKAGTFMGRLPSQKTIHYVDAKTGVALCDKERKSIRESWVHHNDLPAGQRVCGKCRKAMEL